MKRLYKTMYIYSAIALILAVVSIGLLGTHPVIAIICAAVGVLPSYRADQYSKVIDDVERYGR